MRVLLKVCAGIAIVSGAMSFTLWRELRAERQMTADLRTQLDEAKAANRSSMAAARGVNAAVAVAAPATGAAGNNDGASAARAPAGVPLNVQNIVNLEQDLMKDPEYRKLRLAQIRSSVERDYPGLAEELGLSEQEAGKLYDLLAQSQLDMTVDSSILGGNGTPDQAAMQQMVQRQQMQRREQETAIRSLLGDGKYGQWQEYQQTRSARQRVVTINTQLAQAGMPLSDSQSRALTTALIGEQQRQRQEQQAMARTLTSGNQNDPGLRAQLQEELLKRNEDNNRRMLDAAAPYMNARQLAALREQMEQQAAMSRISSRMQMERSRMQPQAQSQ